METMTTLASLAERVSRGDEIAERDVTVILESHDLLTIGGMADDVRRRMHGTTTTFLRVFEVHVDAPCSSLPAGAAPGELRIVGRPDSVDTLLSAATAAVSAAGRVPVTASSLADLIALAASAGLPLETLAVRLRETGVAGVSELPIDLVEEPAAAVELVRRAGLAVERLAVHHLADDARLSTVARARDLQQAVGGFRAFAPLPRVVPVTVPTTGFDDVKQVAIARLVAANIPSIQVDWPLYGPKLAQVALTMGADDVDGIAAFDPAALGTRRSAIEEIKRHIRAAALEPVERNGRFEVVG
jgi:aminodeoxyfutalosine synthase